MDTNIKEINGKEDRKINIKKDTVITVIENDKLKSIYWLDQKTHHVVGFNVDEMNFEEVERSLQLLAGVSILNIGVDYSLDKEE